MLYLPNDYLSLVNIVFHYSNLAHCRTPALLRTPS